MKVSPLSRDQVRQVDQIATENYGIPGIVLMENAGRGAAEIIDRIAPKGPIAILCGPGNNGGDGYVIARHLQLMSRDVRIISLVDLEKLTGDAKTNAEIAVKSDIDIVIITRVADIRPAIGDASTIIDCLLGTGAIGSPRGLFADAVEVANAATVLRIAIDIPTGLDCDTGLASQPAFRADHTISFVATKIGFEKENADEFVGVVHVVGIGVPEKLLCEWFA